VGRYGLDLCGLGYGHVVDSCEYGNALLGSITGSEFPD
jgi:hypothetical protein